MANGQTHTLRHTTLSGTQQVFHKDTTNAIQATFHVGDQQGC